MKSFIGVSHPAVLPHASSCQPGVLSHHSCHHRHHQLSNKQPSNISMSAFGSMLHLYMLKTSLMWFLYNEQWRKIPQHNRLFLQELNVSSCSQWWSKQLFNLRLNSFFTLCWLVWMGLYLLKDKHVKNVFTKLSIF